MCRASLPTRPATTEQAQSIQTGLYIAGRKKERLHALLLAHQFQGGVPGHVGGVRVALDHGGDDGPFNQNGHGRGDLRRRLANRLLDHSTQKRAEALLVPPKDSGAGMIGIGQSAGAVRKGEARKPGVSNHSLRAAKKALSGVFAFLPCRSIAERKNSSTPSSRCFRAAKIRSSLDGK